MYKKKKNSETRAGECGVYFRKYAYLTVVQLLQSVCPVLVLAVGKGSDKMEGVSKKAQEQLKD